MKQLTKAQLDLLSKKELVEKYINLKRAYQQYVRRHGESLFAEQARNSFLAHKLKECEDSNELGKRINELDSEIKIFDEMEERCNKIEQELIDAKKNNERLLDFIGERNQKIIELEAKPNEDHGDLITDLQARNNFLANKLKEYEDRITVLVGRISELEATPNQDHELFKMAEEQRKKAQELFKEIERLHQMLNESGTERIKDGNERIRLHNEIADLKKANRNLLERGLWERIINKQK